MPGIYAQLERDSGCHISSSCCTPWPPPVTEWVTPQLRVCCMHSCCLWARPCATLRPMHLPCRTGHGRIDRPPLFDSAPAAVAGVAGVTGVCPVCMRVSVTMVVRLTYSPSFTGSGSAWFGCSPISCRFVCLDDAFARPWIKGQNCRAVQTLVQCTWAGCAGSCLDCRPRQGGVPVVVCACSSVECREHPWQSNLL